MQARVYPSIARVVSNHAYSYHEDRLRRHVACPQTPYTAYACLAYTDVTYSAQCSSDKICFQQLRIKYSVTKSCPGTHTTLQAPMNSVFHVDINMFHNADFLLATYNYEFSLILARLKCHTSMPCTTSSCFREPRSVDFYS